MVSTVTFVPYAAFSVESAEDEAGFGSGSLLVYRLQIERIHEWMNERRQ